jgi:hypothetical protein
MRLEWILLAEGIGTNAGGAVTAISINQNVLAAHTLPATTKRVILAHFVGGAEETAGFAGKEVTATVQVISPSGEAVFAASAGGRFPTPTYVDLPSGLDIAMELPLRVLEYGTYDVRVSAQTDDEQKMQGQTQFYVKLPPSGSQ